MNPFKIFQKEPEPDICEWLEENIIIPQKLTAMPGPVSFDKTPYLREILRNLASPGNDIEEITVKKPTQSGFTLSYLLWSAYIARFRPGPEMIIMPSAISAQEINEERLFPLLSENECTNEMLVQGYNKQNRNRLRLKSGPFITVGWSSSATRLASKAIKYLIMDEIAKYPELVVDESPAYFLAKERTRTFWDRKIYSLSTPIASNTRFTKIFEKGAIRKLWVKCPYCGEYQILTFDHLKGYQDYSLYDIDNDPTIKVYYECMHCHQEIHQEQKEQMVSTCLWVEDQAKIINDQVYYNSNNKHLSYEFNCLYSPFLTFREIAMEYLNCKDDIKAYQNFCNSWLAQNFEGSMVDEDLSITLNNATDEVMHEEIINPEQYVCTIGVDVQVDAVYYVIRLWDQTGKGKLYSYGFFHQEDHKDEFIAFAEFLYEIFKTNKFYKFMIFIDSPFRREEVISFCRRIGTSICVPTVGGSNMNSPMTYRAYDKDKELKIVRLNISYLKDCWSDYYKKGNITIPKDVDKAYLMHLNSERRMLKYNRKTGNQSVQWEVKDGFEDNHYFDCEIYCYAALRHYTINYFAELDAKNPIVIAKPKDVKKKLSKHKKFNIINAPNKSYR